MQINNKQRLQYFISYMSVAVFIALLVMGSLYLHTVNMVKTQLSDTTKSATQAQQQILDRVFWEMEQISMQIDTDAALTNYRLAESGYDTYQGMMQLKRYIAANDFFSDIAFLFPNRQILSSEGTFSLVNFCKRYSLSGVVDGLEEFWTDEALKAPFLYPVSDGNQMLAVFPLPMIGLPKARLLLFLLNKKQIDELFTPIMQGETSDFLILDDKERVLYQYRPGAQPLTENVTVSRASSTRMPVSYLYLYDEMLASQSFNSLNRRFMQIILFTLLAVILASEIMSRIHYRPVKRLMALVPPESGGVKLKDVEAYMRHMMAYNQTMAQQLQSYTRLTYEYALEQVFLGRLNQEQMTHMITGTGIRFSAPYFTIFRLLFSAYRSGESSALPYYLRASLLTGICAALTPYGNTQGIEWYDASLVILLNHEEAQPDTQMLYGKMAAAVANSVTLTGGCSKTFEKLSQAQYSLYEAIAACELAHSHLIPFMDASTYENNSSQVQSAILPFREPLLNAVSDNRSEAIATLVDKCQQAWMDANADINTLHIQTIGLINSLVSMLGDARPEHFQDSVQELMGNNTLSAFCQALNVLCCSVAETLHAKETAKKDPLLNRILNCIEANYDSPSTGVQSIADKLSMSASYMTRYMRDHMNTTPSKYIEHIRIQRAKELLINSTLQVKEITCKVGYSDSSSFVRKFKGETGYTPAQYRNTMKNMNTEKGD